MNTANRYEQQEQAIACGQMLRECAKFEPLARVVIQAEQLYDFFRYVEHPSFDIASDAFLTFKVRNCSTDVMSTVLDLFDDQLFSGPPSTAPSIHDGRFDVLPHHNLFVDRMLHWSNLSTCSRPHALQLHLFVLTCLPIPN